MSKRISRFIGVYHVPMVKRLLVALPLAGIGAAWAYYLFLPWPLPLRWREPDRTSFMEYRLREAAARGETLEIRHEWVPLNGISRHLRRAVIVAEDARFYDHDGIDWGALREELRYDGGSTFSWRDPGDLRAAWSAVNYYRHNRDRIRGRSTITQQLAKNLYFTPEKSLRRKAEELIVTRRIERSLSKDRILEMYLNTAEWGPGIFGAEAAARRYFGQSAAGLGPEQAAALAATLPHPLTSNPAHRPERMRWRQRLILQRMGAAGPVETVPLAPEDSEADEPATPGPELLGEPVDRDDPVPDQQPDDAAEPGDAPEAEQAPEPPDESEPPRT